MGKRHTGRKLAMQALYQAEIKHVQDIVQITDDHITNSKNYSDETKEWATYLAQKTWQNRATIDPMIASHATGWDFSRINPVDKSILRMAVFELFNTRTPYTVVVDEAIEIAKKYATDDSSKFINGILGTLIQEHQLSAPTPE
jgi:N utilization substance protein B